MRTLRPGSRSSHVLVIHSDSFYYFLIKYSIWISFIIILLNTYKNIKSCSHHMSNMIIFELFQRVFLLQGQHTRGNRRASSLVLNEKKNRKAGGNVLTK